MAARRPKPKIADTAPPSPPACLCGHPKARHWSGLGGYSRLCLHRQITGELCLCLEYMPAVRAAVAA